MASQTAGDDEDEGGEDGDGDLLLRFNPLSDLTADGDGDLLLRFNCRFSPDFEKLNLQDAGDGRASSALRDEAALKEAMLAKDGIDVEMASLRSDVMTAKIEASTVIEQLRETQSEVKALRTMTQIMVLSQHEMEEIVLKRCWLARYWGLAAQLGNRSIHLRNCCISTGERMLALQICTKASPHLRVNL